MELLASFITGSIEHGYFSTALMLLIIFGIWKLYKGEQDRGRDFGTRFATELKQLIENNNKALKECSQMIKEMTNKQDLENKHNSDLRTRLEADFRDLKNEVQHLEDDIKELKITTTTSNKAFNFSSQGYSVPNNRNYGKMVNFENADF